MYALTSGDRTNKSPTGESESIMSNNINEILATLNENSKKRGNSRVRANVIYTQSVPEDMSVIQLPPQAITLVGIILADTLEEWREPELMDLIEENVEQLKTKQPSWKIFQFYRKKLIDARFLSMAKESTDSE